MADTPNKQNGTAAATKPPTADHPLPTKPKNTNTAPKRAKKSPPLAGKLRKEPFMSPTHPYPPPRKFPTNSKKPHSSNPTSDLN